MYPQLSYATSVVLACALLVSLIYCALLQKCVLLSAELIIIINMLMPVKQNHCAHLRVLLVLIDRGMLAQSKYRVVDGRICPSLGGPTRAG
jgi:hypothetical protein